MHKSCSLRCQFNGMRADHLSHHLSQYYATLLCAQGTSQGIFQVDRSAHLLSTFHTLYLCSLVLGCALVLPFSSFSCGLTLVWSLRLVACLWTHYALLLTLCKQQRCGYRREHTHTATGRTNRHTHTHTHRLSLSYMALARKNCIDWR